MFDGAGGRKRIAEIGTPNRCAPRATAVARQVAYHLPMSSGPDPAAQQRLAQLKQRQRELTDLFAQCQGNRERAEELVTMLVEVGIEIAELELQVGTLERARRHA